MDLIPDHESVESFLRAIQAWAPVAGAWLGGRTGVKRLSETVALLMVKQDALEEHTNGKHAVAAAVAAWAAKRHRHK